MIEIGNGYDHIYVLIKISVKTVISEIIKEFKGSTSYFINNRNKGTLYWQDGYGVVSVSILAVKTVQKYIQNQKTRHINNETIEDLEKTN